MYSRVRVLTVGCLSRSVILVTNRVRVKPRVISLTCRIACCLFPSFRLVALWAPTHSSVISIRFPITCRLLPGRHTHNCLLHLAYRNSLVTTSSSIVCACHSVRNSYFSFSTAAVDSSNCIRRLPRSSACYLLTSAILFFSLLRPVSFLLPKPRPSSFFNRNLCSPTLNCQHFVRSRILIHAFRPFTRICHSLTIALFFNSASICTATTFSKQLKDLPNPIIACLLLVIALFDRVMANHNVFRHTRFT